MCQSVSSDCSTSGAHVRELSQKSEVMGAWISLQFVDMKRPDLRDILKEK